MGCGKSNPCGGCGDKKPCDCEVKDLGTKCVIYDGEGLDFLGLDTNTDLTTVIDFIDDAFTDMQEYVDNNSSATNAVNLGEGEYVYAGKDILNRLTFKSFVAGDNINIASNDDTITISSTTDTSDLISGDNYINVDEASDHYNLSFDYSRITATDGFILVNSNNSNVDISLDVDAVEALIPDVPEVNIESETIVVQKTGNNFTLEIPDDGIKKFYVNNAYTGGNSDGSIGKPFTNINQAVNAFIGTGTYLSPQYASQNAKIVVQRSGSVYTLPTSLLVRNLYLELEDGVSAQTNISNTEYLIDYTSIPTSYTGDFPITIVGSGRNNSSINTRKPFVSHNGMGIGTNQRRLVIEGVRLNVNNGTTTQPIIKVDSQALPSDNVGVRISVNNSDIWNNTYENTLFYLKGRGLSVFSDSEIRLKTTDAVESDVNSIPMIVEGGSADFNSCRIKAYREFLNGAIELLERPISGQGRLNFKNCVFEGDTPIWFVTEGDTSKDMTEVEIVNADYYYEAYGGRLVETSDSLPSQDFTIINSFFKTLLGDADLTKGDSMSTVNYFNSSLREDLMRSTQILTTDNSSFQYGTPYIHMVDEQDKTTWVRKVVV